jgi:hypothetical protein
VLQRAYQQGPRDTLDALLWGRNELPSTPLTLLPSVHLPASGYAILRSTPTTATEQCYLLLKYGPHGGGHGHPDKLSLILSAYGQRLSPDLGTPGYGLDLFESWYRQTICHNTVTIDGYSQPEATGQINHFQDTGDFQVADAAVAWTDDGPYQGVTMRRVILARPDYFLDLFLVETPDSRRIDWIYRNAGQLQTTLPLTAYPTLADEGEGYRHIAHPQHNRTDKPFQASWQSGAIGLQLWAAGAPGTDILTGSVLGNPPTDHFVTLLQRQQGATATFLTLFHPFRATPTVTSVEWFGNNFQQTGWLGCRVTLGDQQEHWLLQSQSDGAQPRWFTAAPADRKLRYCLTPSQK